MGAYYLIDRADIYQEPGVIAEREAFVNLVLTGVLFLVVGVLLVTSLKRYSDLEARLEKSIAREKTWHTLMA